jgi:RNA polymerase sigma-70 factor (ECF subfamily)
MIAIDRAPRQGKIPESMRKNKNTCPRMSTDCVCAAFLAMMSQVEVPTMAMTEERTILLAKEGLRNAFRSLYETHRLKVYRIAFRYARSQPDAEDIMQETFIRAFKGIKSFDFAHGAGFEGWICRICANCAIEHLRRNKRRKKDKAISLTDLPSELPGEGRSPEKAAQLSQTIRQIRNALTILSPRQRVIFNLRYDQNYNIREIADVLQCSESSIKTQLSRSMAKLRKKLEPLWGEQ